MTASTALPSTKGSAPRRPLRFGFSYEPGGSHPAGWRQAGGGHDPYDPDDLTAVAREAEAAGFDFIQFGHRVPDDTAGRGDKPAALTRTEPFTTASFLATRTRHIGLLVTANTSYTEPFNLARTTASLDHVTHGRAGWNITTGVSHPVAQQFSQADVDPAAHYARATEVVDVVRRLWDSWEDDAFIRDKATGDYVDGSKIHAVNHKGNLFSIKGPLNVARPPQGQLVVAHEIADNLSIGLAVGEADLAFVSGDSPAAIAETIATLRRTTTDSRRAADAILAFAAVTPVIADTLAQARALYDTLNAAITLDRHRDLASLSREVGVDVTGHALGDAITSSLANHLNANGAALLDAATARTGRTIDGARPLTIADLLFAHLVPGIVLVGDAETIADAIATLSTRTGADGILIRPAFLPDQLHRFAVQVAPVLEARGLLQRDDFSPTLRARLGFPRLFNRLAAA